MSTFDGWETRLCGDAMALPNGDELMHFRTKGSKNGVRRYQTESGEWTPLGLKERKAREGWGDSRKERRAMKDAYKAAKRSARADALTAKLERKAAKAEKKASKANARKEKAASLFSKKKKVNLDDLSDEELRKKIERIKMEQEYKEMTRSPLLKNGEKLVSSILESRARKADREEAAAKRELDNNRIKAEIIKAQESTKRAKAEAIKAKEDRKKMKQDRKAGLAKARAAELQKAKTAYRETTIRGGIARRINTKLTAGLKEKVAAKRKAEGEAAAKRIQSDSDFRLKKYKEDRKLTEYREGVAAYEKEQARLRRERQKTQREYEKRLKRIKSYG